MTASFPQTWLSAAINHIMEPEITIILNGLSYRVIGNSGPKVIAYCSQNMKIMDFLTPLGAPQMWSI